jgi:hypothetical protein
MPLYKARDIAWLALESLCRQKDIDFEWELIIIEEDEKCVGEALVRSYESRLSAVGCRTPVTYISLSKWIPLAQKWRQIAQIADSNGFLLVAGDDYSNPNRLAETKKLFETTGAEWIHTQLGYFYDIVRDNLAVWDHSLTSGFLTSKVSHPCGAEKAIRTELMKALPESDKARHVDGWIFWEIEQLLGRTPNAIWNKSESWKKGLFTDGFNSISNHRSNFYKKKTPKGPFRLPVLKQANCAKCDSALYSNQLQSIPLRFSGLMQVCCPRCGDIALDESNELIKILPLDIVLRLQSLRGQSLIERCGEGTSGLIPGPIAEGGEDDV